MRIFKEPATFLNVLWYYWSVSVSCQLNEVFKHFEWNSPLKRFDTAGLVLWYSFSFKTCHSASPQTIWKCSIYAYMFCMIWNNFVDTVFFQRYICCIAHLLVYTQILFNRILAYSFIFNCEYHSLRCKPQINEPKSLYFVKFSIL